MSSLAVVRAQVESRLPGALTVYDRPEPEVFPTGIASLDEQIRGIPQSALTQIHAPLNLSSGKTALLVSLMAQVTRREQFCALVDASDCFDPQSAEAAGVNLARVLWVRCAAHQRLKPLPPQHANTARAGGPFPPQHANTARAGGPLEQAFKAADILVQNGGFALIVVDLGNIEEKLVRRVPLTTWFRFARVVEKMPAALVFLLSYPAAQSCAGLTLRLEGAEPDWSSTGKMGVNKPSHAQFLSRLRCEVEIGRSRIRKPVQSAGRPKFAARPEWA
jgi:recA bacterial DNA recombination protein